MKILPNGEFSVTWNTEDLKKGSAAHAVMSRSQENLATCKGALGTKGILRALEELSINDMFIDEDELVVLDDFPFPQLIVTERLVLVCNRTSILEVLGDATLVEAISELPTGARWQYASSFEYIYLSNGEVTVVRDPFSREWAIDTTLPKAGAILNYKGQIFVGNSRW